MSETDRNRILFYVGLPVVIGFMLGANRAGIGASMPWPISVLFWVTCTLAAWLVFHLGTVAAAYLLAPWEPPLSAKLALGLLIASLPARLLINGYLGFFESLMLDGRSVQALAPVQLTWDFALQYAQGWSGPYVLWITANVFFDRVVGFSRYRARPRHEAPGAGDPAPSLRSSGQESPAPCASPAPLDQGAPPPEPRVSALLSRLPRSLGYNILAIKSEDHYLRVFTDRGDALILYKLSTAMDEMESHGYHGLQVHRSFWVRREAVQSVISQDRKVMLCLSNGVKVPVSQTYRESVRRAGFHA